MGARPATTIPALARTLDGIEFDRPMPSLWNEFRALSPIPVLAIRGANSDLLSAETLAEMAAVHPRFDSMTVAGEGHAPLLRGAALLHRIATFIAEAEGAAPPADAVAPRTAEPFDLDARAKAEERSG